MPKVSFYLRNEDIDTWKSIARKTEWIHNNLENEREYEKYNSMPVPEGTITLSRRYDAFVKPEVTKVFVDESKDFQFCKHDAVKGMCKMGCK